MPVLEEQPYKTEDCLLEGEPPSPIDLPTGCSFRARCPLAYARCKTEEPPLYPRGDGRVGEQTLMAIPIMPDGSLDPARIRIAAHHGPLPKRNELHERMKKWEHFFGIVGG